MKTAICSQLERLLAAIDPAKARMATRFAVALGFALLYFCFFTNSAELYLEVETPEPSILRVYWAGGGQEPFRQGRESHLRLRAGRGAYRLELADLARIGRLRIDPTERRAAMTIRRMTVTQQGFVPLLFERAGDWERLRPLQQVEGLRWSDQGLFFATTGGDAQLELPLSPQRRSLDAAEWFRFLLLLAVLGLILGLAGRKGGRLRSVPAGLGLALGLVLCMALLTQRDLHPDEWAHLAAGEYYETRWLPPKICDPDTRSTFSVYGASRLLSKEIAYLLAGKVSRLVRYLPLELESHQRLRLFNALLLATLLLAAVRHRPYRFLCLPLLLTPQAWYIFAYFNSEALALTLSLLWTGQLFDRRSTLHQVWRNPRGTAVRRIGGLGMLLAPALMIKQNYYIVGLFLTLEALRHLLLLDPSARRRMLAGSALLLAVGTGLVGIKLAGDWSVNGLRQRQAILRCREEMAAPAYRTDTPLEAQHPLWHLRQRGVGWREIFDRHRWGEKSFRSAVGVYGYLSLSAPVAYYRAYKTIAILLFLSLAALALRRPPSGYRFTLAGALLCALALTAALFWHAWTGDMQAQGRYFLPLLPLIGALLLRGGVSGERVLPTSLAAALFLLSLTSFLLIGLARLLPAG